MFHEQVDKFSDRICVALDGTIVRIDQDIGGVQEGIVRFQLALHTNAR